MPPERSKISPFLRQEILEPSSVSMAAIWRGSCPFSGQRTRSRRPQQKITPKTTLDFEAKTTKTLARP
jgi:hypothetical protein